MRNYLDLATNILENGELQTNRTGVDTLSIFGTQLRWDLSKGFPAITTKKLFLKAVIGELLWFLKGSTNIYELADITYGDRTRNTIWTPNYENQAKALGYTDGELGPVYGKQWRDFNGVDQIANLIEQIKTNPDSRRLIVSAWNPLDLDQMALQPCHTSFQVRISDNKLSLLWNQRSVDVFHGLCFNMASYALLAHILAELTGYEVGDLVFSGGDTHIYTSHIPEMRKQINRIPYKELPTLNIRKGITLENLKVEDFNLINYFHHEPILAKMVV